MANWRRIKEQAWRERLERFEASGLTIRAFCEQEQVKDAAFYYWRSRIAQRDGSGDSPPSPTFVPMVMKDQPVSSHGMEILLAGGRVLRLPESISVERVAQLVHALEAGEVR